jgi:hypothetical protein
MIFILIYSGLRGASAHGGGASAFCLVDRFVGIEGGGYLYLLSPNGHLLH